MTAGWSSPPTLVAGPCALEGDEVNLAIADALAELREQLGLRVLYKGSFDKANRSRADAPRGLGIDRGLEALRRVRDATGLPVLTDIHEPHQAGVVAAVADVIQIPAFLCRQTDLLTAAGATGLPVNVKKGQWMAPEAMAGAVAKVTGAGAAQVAVTERGTFFGYQELVVDMTAFGRLKAATGATVWFDATHAAQRPGMGPGGSSGGAVDRVPALLLGAAAAGADGFYLETHPDPGAGVSDRETMWPLERLGSLVRKAVEVWEAARDRQVVGA